VSPLHPNTSYAAALSVGITCINNTVATSGDKDIPNGSQTLPDTDSIRIYAEDAGGHHLTWGVFEAALMGLSTWIDAISKYEDATYQIKDGANQVAENKCVFAAADTDGAPCVTTTRVVACMEVTMVTRSHVDFD